MNKAAWWVLKVSNCSCCESFNFKMGFTSHNFRFFLAQTSEFWWFQLPEVISHFLSMSNFIAYNTAYSYFNDGKEKRKWGLKSQFVWLPQILHTIHPVSPSQKGIFWCNFTQWELYESCPVILPVYLASSCSSALLPAQLSNSNSIFSSFLVHFRSCNVV